MPDHRSDANTDLNVMINQFSLLVESRSKRVKLRVICTQSLLNLRPVYSHGKIMCKFLQNELIVQHIIPLIIPLEYDNLPHPLPQA